MVQVAECAIMLSIALFLFLPGWLSFTLFAGGWVLVGTARIVDGFAAPDRSYTADPSH
jgi:hypothetical protein